MKKKSKSMLKQSVFILLAFLASMVRAEVTYYHTNVVGSPALITDENGAVASRSHYKPFGDSVEGVQQDVGYTGHQHDAELGLTYMQARYYDPVIGRFYSNDPVGFLGHVQRGNSPAHGFNRYAYANNNPYKYTDPDGEFVNFAVKFAADVALGVAINYATTGKAGLGAALKDSAAGVLNPAKTVAKAAKLAKVLRKGKCCFVAGTQVLTEDGYKNIEDVKLGEKLWAKNTETGEQDWKPVTKIFVEPDRGIYEIKLIGSDGFEQKIQATDDHPFYVVGDGWKTTIELAVGDYIETDGDGAMMVTSVIDEKRQDLTYNFTVADFHTYYVTERKVLVHNCNPTKASRMQQKVQKGQAPKGIERFDGAERSVKNSKDHVHFKDGTSMNNDGTIHDKKGGIPDPTNKEKKFLQKENWPTEPKVDE